MFDNDFLTSTVEFYFKMEPPPTLNFRNIIKTLQRLFDFKNEPMLTKTLLITVFTLIQPFINGLS